MKKVIVALIALFSTGAVLASDWRFIATTDSFDLYADAASFTPAPLVKVWVRFDGKPPFKTENGHIQVQGMEHWSIDCSNKTIATSDYTGYDASGTAVISKAGSTTQFHEIAPDSLWDLAATRLCESDAMK